MYSVDPFLTGRKIELVFDPFDMTRDDGLLAGPQGRRSRSRRSSAGTPTPRPRPTRTPRPAALTGIDYLQLVADADAAALGGQPRLAALDDSARR